MDRRRIGWAALVAALALWGFGQAAVATVRSPHTFFLTHYELVGDPNKPTGVRYHSNGRPSAKAPGGEILTLAGKGAWDPARNRAEGGGRYTIQDAKGKVTAQGIWRVRRFISFEQMDGWWEAGFKQFGWQGPAGSVSFSGFLIVTVMLERLGAGVLMMWCLMPGGPMVGDHQGDGFILVGPRLNFIAYGDSEMSTEGVMFYSTDPKSRGYAIRSDGTTSFVSPRR